MCLFVYVVGDCVDGDCNGVVVIVCEICLFVYVGGDCVVGDCGGVVVIACDRVGEYMFEPLGGVR